MIEQTKQYSGICPECGSKDLDYDGYKDVSDDTITYPFICTSCKTEGIEFHTIEYHHTEVTK